MTETAKQQLLALAADLRRQADDLHRHAGYTNDVVARFFAADTVVSVNTADRLEQLANSL